MPNPAEALTPSHVQSRAKEITTGTVNSLAFSNANTAGKLIVVYLIWNTGSAGKYGSGLSFNGSSGNVNVPHSASLSFNSSYILEAWVNPTALSGYQTILIKEVTGGCGYWLQTAGNRIASGFSNGGCREYVSGTPTVPLNRSPTPRHWSSASRAAAAAATNAGVAESTKSASTTEPSPPPRSRPT